MKKKENTSQPKKIQALDWRLHIVMAQRGMTTAKALQAALLEHNVTLSTSTVSRIVYKQPVQLDLSLLAALCAILQCTPNDLFLGGLA